MIRKVTFTETVTEYCDGILSGEIVACVSIKQAVEKYLAEIDKQLTPDFPYYFDQKEADKSCAFFPLLLRHSKGQWVGQAFHLSPWQVFATWNIYGWKRQDDECRRFTKFVCIVAKKNGKSTWAAGFANKQTIADNEAAAETFIAGPKLDQAKIIFDEAYRMAQKSPHIAKHCMFTKNNIAYPATDSFCRPIGADKPYDGPSISTAILDELHAFKEHQRDFYDTMTIGGGARTQPLVAIFTTAGDEKSYIYLDEYAYAKRVIEGVITDDTLFAQIFELDEKDDIFDEGNWVKANPNIGVSCSWKYMRQQATQAKNQPAQLNKFKRYHCNLNVTSHSKILTLEKWQEMAGELSDWKTADAVGLGIDAGGRNDLASIGVVAKFEVESDNESPIWRYEAKSFNFIAEDCFQNLRRRPWDQFILDGDLEVVEYVFSALSDRALSEALDNRVEYIGFDPHKMDATSEELQKRGMKAMKLHQNHGAYHAVMTEWENAMAEGRFKPCKNDMLLQWAAINLVIDENPAGKKMPSKRHSKEKIDPMVAVLMGLRAVMASRPRAKGSLFVTG